MKRILLAFLFLQVCVGRIRAEPPDLVNAHNEFALQMLQEVAGEPGNLFFSPVSILTAFTLATEGAAGKTRTEMEQTLHLPPGQPDIALAEAEGKLQARIADSMKTSGAVWQTANGLWIEENHQILPGFIAAAGKLASEVAPAEFSKQPQIERTRINRWVEKRTHDRIHDLFAPSSISSQTALVIANAVYFKGEWEHVFAPKATQPAVFHSASGGEATVPMMRQTATFRYAEVAGTQWIELPYRKSGLSMVLALPAAGTDLEGVLKRLAARKLDTIRGGMTPVQATVQLPRFKMDYALDLVPPLRRLGMAQAFSPGADFSRLSVVNDLYIDVAVHKAFVEVNEAGTEASAATGIAMGRYAMPLPPVIWRGDRPFLFFIWETSTGLILFTGRVAEMR